MTDGSSPEPSPSPWAIALSEFASQVRFFSRLPLPRLGPADDLAAPPPFARAIRLLPIAALPIAAPGALLLALLAATDLSSATVATLALIVQTLVTGAFHEDGFADVADAFAGGATPARRLEIMKDSRIGSFGGVALVAQFVLRVTLLAELTDRHDALAGVLVLAVAPLARMAPMLLSWLLPPARADGLGRSAGRPETQALSSGLVVALGLFAAAAVPIVGPNGTLLAVALAAAGLAGLAALAKAKIGGVTGDVLGAGILTTEMALLIGLSA